MGIHRRFSCLRRISWLKLRLTLFNLYGKSKVATNNKANMANILDILFNLFFEFVLKFYLKFYLNFF